MNADPALALQLADAADAATLPRWSPHGVASSTKVDGTPVTEADVAAELAIQEVLQQVRPDDGMLGEETGEIAGTSERRWVVDGIDGTRFYAAGEATWGTLIALELDGSVVLGVSSSPAQDRRWWASLGTGAFTGHSDLSGARRIRVSTEPRFRPQGLVSLPKHGDLAPEVRHVLERLSGGTPMDRAWSHQNHVAEGKVDVCVWFAGDVWDHAAPSIIVTEAGGRFTDQWGGNRLDTRTGVYSNGLLHDQVVAALTVV